MNNMQGDFNITGTWINRMTGDKITVRNTFIDGDNMIIQSSDGRQISMAEFQNYIQMEDNNEYDEQGHVVGKSSNNDMGLNIGNIEKERRVVVGSNFERKVVDNSFEDPFENKKKPKKPETKKESESDILLRKLFEKVNLDVDVKVDLDCTNFPSKELNMLQMIYDVTLDEISDYIIKHVIDETLFKAAVSSYVKTQLS